jgi:hypothetical protein
MFIAWFNLRVRQAGEQPRGCQDLNKRHKLQKLFCGKNGDPPSLFNYIICPKIVKICYLSVLTLPLPLRLLSLGLSAIEDL